MVRITNGENTVTTFCELHLTEKEASMTKQALASAITQNHINHHLDGKQSAALDRVETKLKKLFEAKERK